MSTGIKKIKSGGGHYYKVDGQKYDGVTTLLGDGLSKKGLINWAGNATAGYAVDHWTELGAMKPSERLKTLEKSRYLDRDAAANRGTEVHALAEKLMHGEEIDVPEAIAGHVESYVRFLDEWKPEPVVTEAVVANRRWRYCGSLDMVVDLPHGERAICDIKTSRSGIFGETALQVCAYSRAEVYVDDDDEIPMAELQIDTGYAIWIRGDGYDVYPLDIGEDTFRTFQHVMTVARRTKDLRDLVSPAISAPGAAA